MKFQSATPASETLAKLCQFVRAGATPAAAAGSCGATPAVFEEWMQSPTVVEAIKLAEAEARVATQLDLRKKAPATWLRQVRPEPKPQKRRFRNVVKLTERLTARQRLFITEYLADPTNAGAAARRAGYSAATADQAASRLLATPTIWNRIQAERERIMRMRSVSFSRIVQELADVGFVDIDEAFNEDGELLPLHDMPARLRRAISSIEVESTDRGSVMTKIRLNNKIGALDQMAKLLDLYPRNRGTNGDQPGGESRILTPMLLDRLREQLTDQSRRPDEVGDE